MLRAGPTKIHWYSLEFKLKAVKLSQLKGVEVQAVADALEIHPFMPSRRRNKRESACCGVDWGRLPNRGERSAPSDQLKTRTFYGLRLFKRKTSARLIRAGDPDTRHSITSAPCALIDRPFVVPTSVARATALQSRLTEMPPSSTGVNVSPVTWPSAETNPENVPESIHGSPLGNCAVPPPERNAPLNAVPACDWTVHWWSQRSWPVSPESGNT